MLERSFSLSPPRPDFVVSFPTLWGGIHSMPRLWMSPLQLFGPQSRAGAGFKSPCEKKGPEMKPTPMVLLLRGDSFRDH